LTDSRLQGQTAIVTGGGRGIGRIAARSLAAAGASVAVVARTRSEVVESVALIEQEGGRGMALTADVRDARAVAEMVGQVESQFGPVELLVNNAGTSLAIGPLWEVDADTWWQDVEVALRGAFLCSHAVLEGMVQRGCGRIVNVSSRAGTIGIPYQTAYSSSRAALFQFTEGLAGEVAAHGIQVFTFTPGLVQTALTEHLVNSEAGKRWVPRLGKMLTEGTGWVDPRSVGDALVLLASGQADVLSGRWLHAQDDLVAIIRRAAEIKAQDLHVLRLRE